MGLQAVRGPVAENEEGPPPAHAVDLARQRFEEGGWPDDRIAQAGLDQRCLEGQLGVLKGKARLLHTYGGKQHEVADAGLPGCVQHIEVGAMVDRPGVLRRTRARGHARHQGVEPLIGESVARQ